MRTISCMVEALAPYFDFRIVTLNHDAGSSEVYTSVQTDEWNSVGSGQVFYIPRWSFGIIQRMIREVEPDVLYLNGFFSTSSINALLARRLGMLPAVPIILAPRGDLAEGALGLKTPKKRSYMLFARLFGIYSRLSWHASSDREKVEMLRQLRPFGVEEGMVYVAPDLGFGYEARQFQRPEKCPGAARFVTLSRLVRMKNPLFTLERLAELQGEISLDIFGPLEDRELWNECEQKISDLPQNVAVRFLGPLEPSRVLEELSQRHFFVLPTLGENYGHAIIEGAAAGCPVVISDRTQWRGLSSQGAGWDIPLEDTPSWRRVLQSCVDMPGEQYAAISSRASELGRSVMNSKSNLEANIELFQRAVQAVRNSTHETLSAGVSR